MISCLYICAGGLIGSEMHAGPVVGFILILMNTLVFVNPFNKGVDEVD